MTKRQGVFWLGLALVAATTPSLAWSGEDKDNNDWRIDSTEQWVQSARESEGLAFDKGLATPTKQKSLYRSVVRTFPEKRSAKALVFEQSPVWENWTPAGKIVPANLADAPVLLTVAAGDYWIFGRYGQRGRQGFEPQDAQLEGFDVPLKTTPYPNQFDAPGGLKKGLGGYHAWQSRDMVHWVHHGPVTARFSKWVTTAEYVDGKVYIYYDYPNDQDPHLYIDEDLTDGTPGKNRGLAFKDPSHGSDCTFIRDLQGKFHVIYEDWSPINARKHSWDSPLAGHAVSPDGISNFKILPPAIDHRTKPTGKKGEYLHPGWAHHPDWDSNVAQYEVHEPEQHAYGDWAAISIGGQYYLFGDFHPAKKHIRIGWFTSSSLDKPFTFCGEMGHGHPDPDIAFAEGRFYLVNQTKHDYVSPGPWVEKVAARAGVDTDQDGEMDRWTDWQEVKEGYDYVKGFSKQVKRIPASLDLSDSPAGYGFCFEFRTEDTTKNKSKPILDAVTLSFAPSTKPNPAAGAGKPRQANILFIMADDLGKEWISCYGAEDVETPHIDALARGGMQFHNAYSMPQCTPSRVTLLTGTYPWRNGYVNHWDVPRWGVGYFDWKFRENTTFARLLKDLGYATCAAGKWQINDFRVEPHAMRKHGFDDWCMWTGWEAGNPPSGKRYWDPYINTPDGSKTYHGQFGPDVYTDHLINFLKRHKDESMFLYFPMALPHRPLVDTPDEPDAKSGIDKHKAMVRDIDKQVGRLVKALDDLDIRERTIVIFTTDNGTGGFSGTLKGRKVSGGKAQEREAGVCAPFIVNGPGLVSAGVETDALTDFTDLLPTFVELGGGKVPDDLTVDGVSFAPLILGKTNDTSREWIMALGHGAAKLDKDGVRGRQDFATRVIRDKRFKVWVSKQKKIIRMHDLQQDPWEATNLLDSDLEEHKQALQKFQAVLDSLPDHDARPLYEPRARNPWDRQIPKK